MAVPIAATAAAAPERRTPPPGLRRYESRYYVIHSDLDEDTVREASARMTAMAQEYGRRTRGFGGTIAAKLPCYLLSKQEDYQRMGGPPNSTGLYVGDAIVAWRRPGQTHKLWYVLQHEGFHQFAHRGPSPR